MIGAKDDLPPLRDVIRRYGLTARKSLGQNFLFDLNLTERIARAAEPLAGVTVYEVGPGPGGLTRALLALGTARVIAVERDERAIAALQDIAERYPGRLEIIAADALTFDPRTRLDNGPVRIVANLPYNIATALLVSWLIAEPWPPWYDSADLDVSARSRGTHRGSARIEDIRAFVRARTMALRGAHSFRYQRVRVRTAA